ncbi:MAG: hypothetical protein ABIA04_12910 [Pseudomonadota bacterium]
MNLNDKKELLALIAINALELITEDKRIRLRLLINKIDSSGEADFDIIQDGIKIYLNEHLKNIDTSSSDFLNFVYNLYSISSSLFASSNFVMEYSAKITGFDEMIIRKKWENISLTDQDTKAMASGLIKEKP